MMVKSKKLKFGNASRASPTKARADRNIQSDANPGTESYLQEMKDSVSNIMVAVRLRPMWKKEQERGEIGIVKILDRNVVILRDPADVI